jgi:hypothetical protein
MTIVSDTIGVLLELKVEPGSQDKSQEINNYPVTLPTVLPDGKII